MATVRVDMSGATSKVERIKADDGLGRYLANEALRGMDKYVPARTLQLSKSAQVSKPFVVNYGAKYARYPFYGKGRIHQDVHPMATKRWDKAYSAAHGAELGRAGTEYLRRG